MNTTLRTIGIILLLAFAVYLAWYFSTILAYIFISAVLSIMGHPIVRFLDSLHIGRFRFPHTLSTAIALLSIVLIFAALIGTFVPLIVSEANVISRIDVNMLADRLQGPINSLQQHLSDLGIIAPGETLEATMIEKFKSFLSITTFSSVIGQFVDFTGSLFIGISATIFITFFFLKDERMFFNMILLVVPVRYHDETTRILSDSKQILTRYFLGVCLELLAMMSLISIGLTIIGIHNALLLGFLGGLMHIIPYIGPLIGLSIGVLLGITTCISTGAFSEIWPVSLKIAGVFIGANMLDNNFLQPFIFSGSVKAHPLEIFIVFLMAGSVAGILGMVLAIPAYTVIRIIAREFLSEFRIVQKLTARM
jgi:predicted PurR-regulated permease PerM